MLNSKEKVVLYLSTCSYISYKKQMSIIENVELTNMFNDYELFVSDISSYIDSTELKQFEEEYDGNDPTNCVGYDEYYEEVQ